MWDLIVSVPDHCLFLLRGVDFTKNALLTIIYYVHLSKNVYVKTLQVCQK